MYFLLGYRADAKDAFCKHIIDSVTGYFVTSRSRILRHVHFGLKKVYRSKRDYVYLRGLETQRFHSSYGFRIYLIDELLTKLIKKE